MPGVHVETDEGQLLCQAKVSLERLQQAGCGAEQAHACACSGIAAEGVSPYH
jgi:hypothetical protein